MKARLTLIFEKEIDNDEMILLKESEIDKDYNTLYEIFGLWDDKPKKRKLEFLED